MPVCGCWVLGVCLVVCVGCARMWVIDCRLSGVFLFRADALFLCFRGGAVRFSFFLWSF